MRVKEMFGFGMAAIVTGMRSPFMGAGHSERRGEGKGRNGVGLAASQAFRQ